MFHILYILILFISIFNISSCFKQQCDGIKEMKGPIVDAKCNFETVDSAVKEYFVPLLKNLTSRAFFRYFRVDLERPCPFWEDDGECSMQGCSVGECSTSEIPVAWLEMDKDTLSESISTSSSSFTTAGSSRSDNNNKNGDGDPYHGEFLEKDIIGADVTMGDIARSNPNEDILVEYLEERRNKNQMDVDSLQEEYGENEGWDEEEGNEEEEDLNWIDMSEQSYGKVCRSPRTYRNVGTIAIDIDQIKSTKNPISTSSASTSSNNGVYINLLANPEGYTGYGGPSAHRVWQAIQHENCFLMDEVESSNETNEFQVNMNQCTEKRVFYRLMSGLQASISTHVAKDYYYDRGFGEGYWGHNINLFVKAVGSHPNRLTNLYFSFLFVLRAVARAGPALSHHIIHTGDPTDDAVTSVLLKELVESSGLGNRQEEEVKVIQKNDADDSSHVNQCRTGFDEKVLFLVYDGSFTGFDVTNKHNKDDEDDINNNSEALYEPEWAQAEAQWRMRSEFQSRFRNISRIMDCVTCERCRLWGKLQILGLGTAVKILTVPEKMLTSHFLGRQEVIAIVNTLHQLAKSVEFAANINEYTEVVNSQMNIRDYERSSDKQIDDDIYDNIDDGSEDDMTLGLKELSIIIGLFLFFIIIIVICYLIFKKSRNNSSSKKKKKKK